MSSQSLDHKFELLQADDYGQYFLREPREIVFVLRQLAAKRAVVTAYYGSRGDFLLTSMVDVFEDTKTLILDLGKDEDAIAAALTEDSIVCITQMEKIKIQFQLKRPQRTLHEGFPALLAGLPAKLLRLQRREFYRLITSQDDALTCRIMVDPANQGTVDVKVLDISGGGIAIVAPPRNGSFQPDTLFDNCRLDIPEFGPIEVTLRIRNVFRITNPNGTEILRAGCQFLNLKPAQANAIQRYILKVERERKSLGYYI